MIVAQQKPLEEIKGMIATARSMQTKGASVQNPSCSPNSTLGFTKPSLSPTARPGTLAVVL